MFTAAYDATGSRVEKSDAVGVATYNFGLTVERGADSTVYTPGLHYRRNGKDRQVLADRLGTTRYLSDGTVDVPVGRSTHVTAVLRADAFGNATHASGADLQHPETGLPELPLDSHLFAGQHGYERELAVPGLELDYLWQRYYDPAIGRFLTPDPIGHAGGLNLYAYCENDPVNAVDPTGLAGELWYDHWHNNVQYWRGVGSGIVAHSPFFAANRLQAQFTLDSWAGILDLPHAIGHLGEGSGYFAGCATLGNAMLVVGDVMTATAVIAPGMTAARAMRGSFVPPRAFARGASAGAPAAEAAEAAALEAGGCFVAGTPVTVAATSAAAEEVRPGDMLYLPSESADGLHDPWRVVGVRRESGSVRLTLRREARASDRELSLSTAEPVLMQPRPGAGTETPVLLSIPIERLEPGMLVPSRDPSSGRDTLRRIAQTFVRSVQQTVTVALADDAGRVVDTITGTTEHPFFTADGRALPMAALGIGTAIVTRAGPLRVAAVRRERVPAGVRVYNLEVEGDHTYFAGGAGAWVHNVGPCTAEGLVRDHYGKLQEHPKPTWRTMGPSGAREPCSSAGTR